MQPVSAGKHILIVDDYVDALDIWALYLQSIGYRVSTAMDGTTALAKAQRSLPDLIVLDLELPGLSGLDAARTLRADPRTQSIPLIAATGYGHRKFDTARRVGFDSVVEKPCEPDLLVQEIERLLNPDAASGQPDNSSVEHGRENR